MSKTINQIFEEYLDEQKKRLAPRTFNFYEKAISWLGACLDHYGHNSLDEKQYKKIEKALDDIGFCDLFGPQVLNYGSFAEFVGYFLPRKLFVAHDSAKKMCGVALNFYKWCVDKKLVKSEKGESIQESLKFLREEFKYAWEEHDKLREECI